MMVILICRAVEMLFIIYKTLQSCLLMTSAMQIMITTICNESFIMLIVLAIVLLYLFAEEHRSGCASALCDRVDEYGYILHIKHSA